MTTTRSIRHAIHVQVVTPSGSEPWALMHILSPHEDPRWALAHYLRSEYRRVSLIQESRDGVFSVADPRFENGSVVRHYRVPS